MAINIFQGGKTSSNKPVNSAAASTRAQNAQAALATPSSTSNSGATAVANSGTLGKVGSLVGKVAGTAAKFLPGVGGMVAKGMANLLNDPEWWQSVPGDAVTLNQPLRPIKYGTDHALRFAIGEFANPTDILGGYIMQPSLTQVTQYLMPQIRKVVNAVPLQSATSYQIVLQVNAELYAYWRTCKKFRYMMTHGQPYLANMNVRLFPLFQTENSAALDAIINRLEEFLRSNVRLPHTLCEYLAWRYGRVYRSVNSAKAALILYDAFPITRTPAEINARIAKLMSDVASSQELQAANADMYNAYFDHDLLVEIKDDTQFSYDPKEFALRTNLDLVENNDYVSLEDPNPVYLDSALDNPTAFMASTVSTRGLDVDGTPANLFPVKRLTAYIPLGASLNNVAAPIFLIPDYSEGADIIPTPGEQLIHAERGLMVPYADDTNWALFHITYRVLHTDYAETLSMEGVDSFLLAFTALKALDIYNKNLRLYCNLFKRDGDVVTGAGDLIVDASAPAFDMALVPDTTIGQEQVYAFANLVDVSRKHSLSYKAAEKMVAKEVANTVESLDVATASTPSPAAK